MFKFLVIFYITFCFFLIKVNAYAVSNKEDNKNKLKTVTLLLDWKPNTNHLGFYVAKSKGYYKQYGIQLKILNPSPTTSTALVGMGNADFGISYANNLIYARNAKIPIISIAGIIQTDTSCFVWRKSSGIKSFKDLEGKRYGGWGSPEENATLKFISEKNGISFDKIKMLSIGTQDFLPATVKNVDFTWEYKAWNILAATLKGISVVEYCPSEHYVELNKPSPLIITSEKMIKTNPDIVKDFMKATTMGYEFSIKNPQKAAEYFLSEVPELDKNLVQSSAVMLAPLFQSNAKKWGFLEKNKFEHYVEWMKKVDLIKIKPQTSDYLDNSFLP